MIILGAAARRSALNQLDSVQDLAGELKLAHGWLKDVIARAPTLYGRYEVPKSNGKVRVIRPPKRDLKHVQRALLSFIYKRLRPPLYMHGGIPGRSTETHSRRHLGRHMVVTLDVRDFFPSTNRDRLAVVLNWCGLCEEAAEAALRLVTLDGALPQGSPTSCILANFAFHAADGDFRRICVREHLRYSRYVDDIAISGEHELRHLRGELHGAITKNGWKVASEKTAFLGRNEPQIVTGLMVNDVLRPTSKWQAKLAVDIQRVLTEGPEELADEEGLQPQELVRRLEGQARHLAKFLHRRGESLRKRLVYGLAQRERKDGEESLEDPSGYP